MEEEKKIRIRPFLRCLNIPDQEVEMLKKLSIADGVSRSAVVRRLIKKEWQKNERRKQPLTNAG